MATNETNKDLIPSKEWIAVFVTECTLISIINAFTLVTFARNRHLRKRSTYLIINLTVADLLVGAVMGPLEIYVSLNRHAHGFGWRNFLIKPLTIIFHVASQFNLCLISLERLHATRYPFRHCLISNWHYFKVIAGSWVLVLFVSFAMALLELLYKPGGGVVVRHVLASYTFITLLILTVSYGTIIADVRNNPYSRHTGLALITERKLSVTLFIVTIASILAFLPWSIFLNIPSRKVQNSVFKSIQGMLFALYYVNSVVNPIIYVIRLKEFRKAVKEVICKKKPELTFVQPDELHAI